MISVIFKEPISLSKIAKLTNLKFRQDQKGNLWISNKNEEVIMDGYQDKDSTLYVCEIYLYRMPSSILTDLISHFNCEFTVEPDDKSIIVKENLHDIDDINKLIESTANTYLNL